jgi:pyruvate,water dikinase
MQVLATDDFKVSWPDPAMAARPWLADRMHMPDPVPQLAWHTVGTFFEGVFGARVIFVNGYQYGPPPNLPGPPPEVRERGLAAWHEVYVPRIREYFERMKAIDFEALQIAELEGGLDGWVGEAMECFRLTMVVVSTFMTPTFGLVSFLEQALGPEGPVLAGTILQGTENASAGAGAALGRLAEQARQYPELAAALVAGDHDRLDARPGGAAFMGAFSDYLNEYGWRAQSWGVIHWPTWAENPTVPLAIIGRYLANPGDSPVAAVKRSVEGRARALQEAESRLTPEQLERFRELVAATRHHVPISEERALWQLTTVGVLRRPLMALGRKLAAAGAFDSPDDIFYIERHELSEAATNPGPQFAERARFGRAQYEHWRTLSAPPLLGAMPDPSTVAPEVAAMARYFFGLGDHPREQGAVSGFGASAGIVTGRARVIRNLDESGRLEPGDILVCASTAPPWTPLFAIAAAVVTDTGGVMSHSAICAREFGIPCVVGTQVGTNVIPDGATVRVDGTTGRVEMLAD